MLKRKFYYSHVHRSICNFSAPWMMEIIPAQNMVMSSGHPCWVPSDDQMNLSSSFCACTTHSIAGELYKVFAQLKFHGVSFISQRSSTLLQALVNALLQSIATSTCSEWVSMLICMLGAAVDVPFGCVAICFGPKASMRLLRLVLSKKRPAKRRYMCPMAIGR